MLPPHRLAPVDHALIRDLMEWLHRTEPPEALLEDIVAALIGIVGGVGSLDWEEHVGESLDAAVTQQWSAHGEAG